ncbi:MAG: hypothetical protein M1829_000072 [Trizodia sp. TS-e1964]|nr:MAG: hypothetical protein M1829_000072 [Trizodia sp. TS-e1964]
MHPTTSLHPPSQASPPFHHQLSPAMALQTAKDVALIIISSGPGSERRVSPSWSIAHLKSKLEPVTGIPPSAQRLSLRLANDPHIPVEAQDEESAQLGLFPLQPYAELHVADTRPPGLRPNFSDVSAVEKYTMPEAEYTLRSDSVLAWKKSQKLGRFNPDAPALEAAKLSKLEQEVSLRNITVGARCRVGGEDIRRGVVKYIGDVQEIPGAKGVWVGIELDEPLGKNNGSVSGKSYFLARDKCGVFARPERVEVGDWPVLNDLEEMEEL